jgi:aminoglycoside phosphotransferase (APT) family kinase protein
VTASTIIDNALIAGIWTAHRLGAVRAVERCGRGSINPCFIVNDAAVIRFNTFTVKGAARFRNEARAYAALHGSGIPVPEVITVDLTRSIAPYDFIVTSRLPGVPVIDTWADLSAVERERVATEAGAYLAMMHAQTFDRFGALGSGDDRGFDRWYDYVADYLDRYTTLAHDLGAIRDNDRKRMQTTLARYRPLLDTVTRGALVHSDYHWENILQADGTITGVIDFEWALAGDPAWDFIAQDTWEEMCPGSRESVYAGYTRHRPLASEHATRVALYQLLLHVETIVDEARKKNMPGVATARDAMYATLAAVE